MKNSIERVLVTGGAGFIGSHTVDALIEHGYQVTVLDSLEPPTHSGEEFPNHLNKNCDRIKGSLESPELLREVCQNVDAVIHLAALVAGYQSFLEIGRYVSINTRGTANLLDVLVNSRNHVKKLVVASSMTVYGEGAYECPHCRNRQYPSFRSMQNLRKGIWDHLCTRCGNSLQAIPTDESRPQNPGHVYGATKRHQEELCLLVGKMYTIPTMVLRYFNVYGSRQSLTNPYTGVCAIFTSRILKGKPPILFEDGQTVRDYVHVKDVARANILALESSAGDFQAINIGSGAPTSAQRLAENLISMYRSDVKSQISKLYRANDMRECYADISKAKQLLGYSPSVTLREGLEELAEWAKANQWHAADTFDQAMEELLKRGVVFQSG